MGKTKKNYFEHNLNTVADVYKALGHPARLQILQVILSKKKATCGEIVNELPLAQSTVSKHLLELKKVNLIHEHFVGKKTIFSLKKERLMATNDFLTTFITTCKYANAFQSVKPQPLEIIQQAIKSDLQNRTRKPNLSLKAHNYTFTAKKN